METPFLPKRGFGGVVVRFADRRWYLREWHSHAALEMNLVVRGSGSVLLEDRAYPLLPGHLAWIWPGQRHIPSRWSSDMILWIVEWKPRYLRMLKKARKRGDVEPGDREVYACRRLPAQALQRMQGLLSGAAAAERADTFNEGLEFALLALWDEFLGAGPVVNGEFLHPKLGSVLSQLNDAQGEANLEELAERAGLSPYYLSVLFKRQTGLSIPEYRNRVRLNQFFALHRERPEFTLLDLALEAGFGSYAQFYRVFRDSVGKPPKDWLRSVRE